MSNPIEKATNRFAELGQEINPKDISDRVEDLTGRFKVPEPEAVRSVVAYFLRHLGIDKAEYYKDMSMATDTKVADLPQEDGKWVNMRVKMSDIWETSHESMEQVGLIGDDTGRVKFTLWKNAGIPPMKKDKCYAIESVTTSEYMGKISISFNKMSKITEIGDDIDVGNATKSYTGALVHIKDRSGLIKRCPECKRAINSGVCDEHGAVDGINDIRIMAILDSGVDTQDVLFSTHMAEDIWRHSLDEAILMAVNALDYDVVINDMINKLVGRYYTVSGSQMDTMLLVDKYEVV